MEATEGSESIELCLDFANTIDWRNGRSGRTPSDNLKEYSDLLAWSKAHGLIGTEEAKSLGRQATETKKDRAIFRRAIELREAIYRILSAVAHGRRLREDDLELLNGFVSDSMAKTKLIRSGEGFRWSCYDIGSAPDGMLWPIARSMGDLLTSRRLTDLRECANEEEGCGWLFLDESKSHSRKWCSMKSCGNRAKARTFYEAHAKVVA